MNAKWNRVLRNEQGITALETAIILIAFVVVAAIFAFTVLTTGTFLTERSKEAAYAGLQEVRGSMELKGSVVLSSIAASGDSVTFSLATVSGGSSQDMSKLTLTFRDKTRDSNIAYASGVGNPGSGGNFKVMQPDGTALTNSILDTGKLAKLIVYLPKTITANDKFAIEIKPQTGGVLLIERTAPAQIDTITDLH